MTVYKYPKISIISPSLNQGQFIEETILSVLSQNYPNLEYIIIDGVSTDNTLDILEKYSSQLKWISEEDTGQTNAINKGMKLATGEIVAYLNADDILLPNALENVAHSFDKYPNVKWLVGKCQIVDEKGNESRKLITSYKNLLLLIHGIPLLLIGDYISQPATFWKREINFLLGDFDESLDYVMDYEYWLRIYSKFPPLFVNNYLAAFRVHHDSKTTSTSAENIYIDEEDRVVAHYAKLKIWFLLHKGHRWITNAVYRFLSRN